MEVEITKLQMTRKLLLKPLKDDFHKLWKFWETSPQQIEESQRQSQIIAS